MLWYSLSNHHLSSIIYLLYPVVYSLNGVSCRLSCPLNCSLLSADYLLLATFLHWNLIGTSLEPHWNLIGTSSIFYWMIHLRKPKNFPVFYRRKILISEIVCIIFFNLKFRALLRVWKICCIFVPDLENTCHDRKTQLILRATF